MMEALVTRADALASLKIGSFARGQMRAAAAASRLPALRRLAAGWAPAREASSTPRTAAAASAAAPSAAAVSAAPAAAVEPPAATLPPRAPDVTDGPWDAADAAAVRAAEADAARLARQAAKIGGGEVVLARPLADLEALAAETGQPKYRAAQLRDAVLRGARSMSEVSAVPAAWRATLTERGLRTGRSVLHHEVRAADGTRKFLLQLHDGLVVETVGIPSGGGAGGAKARLTVCVSSQVGCPMRCTFCSTGLGGFSRNLLPHEIVDQALTVSEQFGARVSNVVFMGMGEPLLNLPSVLAAHAALTHDLGIGARKITVSTVGVPNAIARLAAARLQSTLAVSIHAPTQALRESIVPSAKAYPLDALLADCAAYFQTTGRRVTFEYTLLGGVNDAPAHAEALAALLRRHDAMRSHVNVIPWNAVDETSFRRPSPRDVAAFLGALGRAGATASARQTRGLEAAAACGQLRNTHQKTPLPEFQAAA
jgi:23S rRNA (adenine2503-C2)-methyltransferase